MMKATMAILLMLSMSFAYNASVDGSGNLVYFDGNDTVIVFFENGTLYVTGTIPNATILMIGGGGAGSSGGGGAGEFKSNASVNITQLNYTVVVGEGGARQPATAGGVTGGNGTITTFFNMTALGGGRGGYIDLDGMAGASGGGGASRGSGATTGGTATTGNNGGGNGAQTTTPYPAGGGGGSASAGKNATTNNLAGIGGTGTNSTINGTLTCYAGGGGGGVYESGGTGGHGSCGGGAGASNTNGEHAVNGTGSGGGGGGVNDFGGWGGSGIVIIRYLTDPGAATANLTVLGTNTSLAGTNQTNQPVPANHSLTSAPLNASYSFTSWAVQGDCTINGQAPNTTVEVRNNCNATASYYWNPISNYGNLTVTCGSGGASCTGTATNFAVPSNRDVSATPSTNYTFSSWSVSGDCTATSSINIHVESGWCNVTALFSAASNTPWTPFSIADFTNSEFIFQGMIPLIIALVASLGITTRKQGDSISFETRKAGIALLPNMAALWYMGFNMGLIGPILAMLTFVACATDGMPFGRVLSATASNMIWGLKSGKYHVQKKLNERKTRMREAQEKETAEVRRQIDANRRENRFNWTSEKAPGRKTGRTINPRPWAITSKNAKEESKWRTAGLAMRMFTDGAIKSTEERTSEAKHAAQQADWNRKIREFKIQTNIANKWNSAYEERAKAAMRRRKK